MKTSLLKDPLLGHIDSALFFLTNVVLHSDFFRGQMRVISKQMLCIIFTKSNKIYIRSINTHLQSYSDVDTRKSITVTFDI